jgi:hypothetical protein
MATGRDRRSLTFLIAMFPRQIEDLPPGAINPLGRTLPKQFRQFARIHFQMPGFELAYAVRCKSCCCSGFQNFHKTIPFIRRKTQIVLQVDPKPLVHQLPIVNFEQIFRRDT